MAVFFVVFQDESNLSKWAPILPSLDNSSAEY